MKKMERPVCTNCGIPMIFSFAIACKEYVCFKCCTGVPLFNGAPKRLVDTDYDDEYMKKDYYINSKLNQE